MIFRTFVVLAVLSAVWISYFKLGLAFVGGLLPMGGIGFLTGTLQTKIDQDFRKNQITERQFMLLTLLNISVTSAVPMVLAFLTKLDERKTIALAAFVLMLFLTPMFQYWPKRPPFVR